MKRFVVDASTLTSGVASRHGGGAPWLLLLALLDFEFEAIVCLATDRSHQLSTRSGHGGQTWSRD